MKATSTQDATKFGTAPVSVTTSCAPIAITSVTPPQLWLADDLSAFFVQVTVQGTGFAAGDLLHTTGYQDLALSTGTSSTQLVLVYPLGTRAYMPRWIDFSVSCADGTGTSNVKTVPFTGNQNTLALDAAGNLFQLDQAQGAPSAQNGYIRKFLANGSANGSCLIGALYDGIAFDDVSNQLLLSSAGGVTVADTNCNKIGGAAAVAMAVATKGGTGCFTQPTKGLLSSFDATHPINPPVSSAAAGLGPWSAAIGTLGAQMYCFAYDIEGKQLLKYRISDMSQQGGFTVNGLTPASQLPSLTGGWQLVAFNSGPAAGTGALLSQFDKVLVLFDLNTMTAIGQPVALSGIPFRIAADETHGTVIVANADVNAQLTRFSKVNAATGTVTQLTSTTPLLAVGFQVAPGGASLDVCMQAQCSVLPNQ